MNYYCPRKTKCRICDFCDLITPQDRLCFRCGKYSENVTKKIEKKIEEKIIKEKIKRLKIINKKLNRCIECGNLLKSGRYSYCSAECKKKVVYFPKGVV